VPRVALLLSLALVAAACADAWVSDSARQHAAGTRAVALPATTTSVEPVPAAPASYRAAACPMALDAEDADRVRCGYLDVAVDRADPDGPQAAVAVAIIASSSDDPRPDPVVHLHGGPGGLALSDYLEWVFPEHPMLADRDLILVDQRGSGWSTPSLNCPTAEESTTVVTALAGCADDLEDEGIDLEHFGTDDIAADLVDLRQVLEIDQWNLYGVSYGTRVALTVLDLDADGVRAVVLDSPYPPVVEAYAEQVPNGRTAIEALLAGCAADPRCGPAFGDLRQPLASLLTTLADDPVPTTVGDDETQPQLLVDDTVLASALFSALYDRFLIPAVPLAVQTAVDGDLAGALDLLGDAGGLQAPRQDSDEEYESLFESELGFWAPECAEEIGLTDLPTIIDGIDTTSALEVALLDEVQESFTVCDRLDVEPADPATQRAVLSAVPTLILVGQFDPITPPAWADVTAESLSAAAIAEVPGSGHAPGYEACPRQAIATFIADLALPPAAPCLAEQLALPFDLG